MPQFQTIHSPAAPSRMAVRFILVSAGVYAIGLSLAAALIQLQKALDINKLSSLAHYRVAEVFFQQHNYQAAADEYRAAESGDGEPKWTEVWSRIRLGQIFDISGQRDRAVNEYKLALRTKDNTYRALEEASKYAQTPYERKRSNN